jgi:hypothetical protein
VQPRAIRNEVDLGPGCAAVVLPLKPVQPLSRAGQGRAEQPPPHPDAQAPTTHHHPHGASLCIRTARGA